MILSFYYNHLIYSEQPSPNLFSLGGASCLDQMSP